jgi:hypothetical protein
MNGPFIVDMTREELIAALASANRMRQYHAAQASALQKQLDELKAEGNALRSLNNTFDIIKSVSEDGEWLLQLSEMIRRHVEKNKPAAVEKQQAYVADVALHTDEVSIGDPQSKNEVEYANYSRQQYSEGTLNFPESDRKLVVNFISFGINGRVIGAVPTRAIQLAEGIAPAVHTSFSPDW